MNFRSIFCEDIQFYAEVEKTVYLKRKEERGNRLGIKYTAFRSPVRLKNNSQAMK